MFHPRMSASRELLPVVQYAAEKHSNQHRKNATAEPYVNHVIRVSAFLSEHGVTDHRALAGALLHDVIEDTTGTFEDIEKRFGTEIAKIVQECSDDKSKPKVDRKKLQTEHCDQISVPARLIKLGDKYDNMSSLLEDPPLSWSADVIHGYLLWGEVIIHKIIRSLGDEAPLPLVSEMFRFLDAVEKFHLKHLKPSWLTLVISGDGSLEAELQKYYDLIANDK